MSHQVEWTNYILDTFLSELKKREVNPGKMELYEKIMTTRCRGWVRTKQCFEFSLSLSTLDRAIKHLKRQYDIIQRECPELDLPIRRSSKIEDFMDAN